MKFLPVSLNIENKKILVIGGGSVAEQKLKVLIQFTINITVISKKISKPILDMSVATVEKEYDPSDLDGFFIVYVCTNDKTLNVEIKKAAEKKSILVNVCDFPEICDFISPAIYKDNAMTVAVSSNGEDVRKSIAWRNAIKEIFQRSKDNLTQAVVPEALLQRKKATRKSKYLNGSVKIVGFGPGDPGMLTLKGWEALQEADEIFYDDFVDKDYILTEFKSKFIYVGKRKGNHSTSQESINQMLTKSAAQGKNVVRLKGGDPLIFGRAGEELDYLRKQGIHVEIIPGITSALSAAAAAQVPLTRRGVASAVTFISAHHAKPVHIPVSKYHTLVYFMGASRLQEIREDLVNNGWNVNTPAVLIQNTSLENQKIVHQTIDQLGENPMSSPVILIVGNVVNSKGVAVKD